MTSPVASAVSRMLAATLFVGALVMAAPALARQPPTQPASPPAAQAPARPSDTGAPPAKAPSDNGWNFDDEEDTREPTTAEVVAPQLVDVGIFTGLMGLALVGFFRKSEKLKVATLVATLVFLGILRSQMYSVVNIFGLAIWNLPIFKHSLFMYLFWAAVLGSTVMWGRLYCGRLCAFGALTQLMDMLVPATWRVQVPAKFEQRAVYFKYAFLAFVVVYYLATRNEQIYRYVEPFWMFTLPRIEWSPFAIHFQWGLATPVMLMGLAVLLVATIFVRNLYCRFICPVGTFLGLISSVTTIFRIKRWAECKTCKICEKTCEWGAIQGPRIVRSECVRCDDCEVLYMDQQKCVHWIVIRRKEDVLARHAAAQAR